MTKISKEIKNAYPDIYGYEHPWDIPGNTKESITVYCIEFEDSDGDKRYCICSKELYESDRNERSKQMKKEDRFTRCWIYSKDGKSRHKCRCKCSECPYGKTERDIKIISTDRLYEDNEYEIADESPSVMEILINEERIKKMNQLISLLNETDKVIVELFKIGKSDSEIATVLNKPRTTIMSRRNRIFADLKEQLKDF